MNKNIIKAIVVGGFMLTSCNNDLLNPYTPGSLVESTAIIKVSDLALLLNLSYAAINSRSESVDVSVFTDEVGIGYANGGQGISDDYVFLMTPNSDLPNAIWAQNYIALSAINRVLALAPNIKSTSPVDEDLKQRIIAQAYTLRAYCHLTILSYFTTDMTSDSALAGILADHVYDYTTANNNTRSTNGEFYKFIHSDLDKAIAIYNSVPNTLDKKVANKFFALGLKARAYEYKGDYVKAETYADQVIAQSGLILANNAVDYQKVFFTDNESDNIETIFRLKRTTSQNGQDYNLHNGWVSIRPNFSGSPFYEISRALFNKLDANQADIRYNTIVAPSSKIDTKYATSLDYRNTDVLIINKHGGVASGSSTAAVTQNNGFNNDIKIMRLSEMYLIKAEARASSSDLPGAANAVNQIRKARISSTNAAPVYASATDAWKGILDERRIEFAFEGYRYLDLKRIGTKANSGIQRNPADYSSSSANYPGANPANLPLTSYKFTLPIPIVELNANSVIKQNPGY